MAHQHSLLIMRHGKSDWNTGATSDHNRPLKKRGRSAARTIAEWLLANDCVPDVIISSSAVRALETAEIVQQVINANNNRLGNSDVDIRQERDLYLATKNQILNIIRSLDERWQRVLVTGHNPGMEELVLALAGDDGSFDDDKPLPTAALACFSVAGPWQRTGPDICRLDHLIYPRQLMTEAD